MAAFHTQRVQIGYLRGARRLSRHRPWRQPERRQRRTEPPWWASRRRGESGGDVHWRGTPATAVRREWRPAL